VDVARGEQFGQAGLRQEAAEVDVGEPFRGAAELGQGRSVAVDHDADAREPAGGLDQQLDRL
jgi:hypothetical protein